MKIVRKIPTDIWVTLVLSVLLIVGMNAGPANGLGNNNVARIAILSGSAPTPTPTPTPTPSGYLLSDDMEYANNAAAAAAGWHIEGSPIFGYATSPAPLQGSYSFNVPTASDASDKSFTATSDVWVYLLVNASSLGSGPYVVVLRDSGPNNILIVSMTSSTVNLAVGLASTGGGSLSPNTTYSFWVHYVKGTGGNAVGEVYFSTTTTKPVSPQVAITGGTSTTDASNFQFYNGQTANAIYDYLRISSTVIGSAPP